MCSVVSVLKFADEWEAVAFLVAIFSSVAGKRKENRLQLADFPRRHVGVEIGTVPCPFNLSFMLDVLQWLGCRTYAIVFASN